MVVKAYDYDTRGAPQSWTKIIAMRHALTLYPDCKFVWFLDQNAYIMDHTKSIENQVADSKRLESLMVKDYPVVPESIIKTFTHLKGEDANLIISQDVDGLVSDSVIIRNGDWAKYFVETWMDPLYRSYNFQKAERHALVCIMLRQSLLSRRLTDPGTHCTMAPDDPLEARPRPTTNAGLVYPQQDGRCVPRRGLCHNDGGLHCVRPCKLRAGITILYEQITGDLRRVIRVHHGG